MNRDKIHVSEYQGSSTWSSEHEIIKPSGLTSSTFGSYVSFDTDVIVVSAQYSNGDGVVFLYRRSGFESWTLEHTVTQASVSEGSPDASFGDFTILDGNVLVIGSPNYNTDAGKVYIIENTGGTTWTYRHSLVSNDVQSGAEFGHSICLSGNWLVVAAPLYDGTTYSNHGTLEFFERSVNTWAYDSTIETAAAYDNTNFGVTMACGGGRLAVAQYGALPSTARYGERIFYDLSGSTWSEATRQYHYKLNDGVIKIDDGYAVLHSLNNDWYLFDTSDWSQIQYSGSLGSTSDKVVAIDTANELIYTSSSSAYADLFVHEYFTAPPTVPPTEQPTNSPTTSPTGAPTSSPTSSPTGSPSTSPTLSPTGSPTGSPTLSPTPDIGTPISVSTVTFFVRNDTDRISVMEELISDLSTQFPDTAEYTVKKQISSIETGIITAHLVSETNNNTLLEEELKKLRCGSADSDCVITIDYGGRRLSSSRDLAAGIYIEITFDLTSDLISTVDGLDLDDPTFEQQLADALGITNLTYIEVTSDGGDITIEATLESLPGDDPLGNDLLETVQELQTNMTDITNALLDALNANDSQVLSSGIDLCPPARDCSGNGSCDDSTGVCVCVGDWWGINCETACECNNGGECIKALCHCPYPYFGLRCDSFKTACDTCSV